MKKILEKKFEEIKQSENPLEWYREFIDFLDYEILIALSKRLYTSKKIGEYKKKNDIKVLQKDRWNNLLENLIKKWEEIWLEKEFIEDIWNRIHKESLKIQEN